MLHLLTLLRGLTGGLLGHNNGVNPLWKTIRSPEPSLSSVAALWELLKILFEVISVFPSLIWLQHWWIIRISEQRSLGCAVMWRFNKVQQPNECTLVAHLCVKGTETVQPYWKWCWCLAETRLIECSICLKGDFIPFAIRTSAPLGPWGPLGPGGPGGPCRREAVLHDSRLLNDYVSTSKQLMCLLPWAQHHHSPPFPLEVQEAPVEEKKTH